MKNTTKMLAIAAFLAAVVTGSAQAINLSELQVKELGALGVAESATSNLSKCVKLTYVGSSTEAVVTLTVAAMTFYAPAGTADTSIGTAGVLDITAAAYDTMGELCDVVEAETDYGCSLLACKRDDDARVMRNQTATTGTNDLKGSGGASLYFDGGVAITSGTEVFVESIGITPNVGRRVVLKSVTANCNVIDSLRAYGKLWKYAEATDGVTRNDTTEVFRKTTADDTDLTVDFTADGASKGLEFDKDEHVVIRCGHSNAVQAAANFLEAFWEEK